MKASYIPLFFLNIISKKTIVVALILTAIWVSTQSFDHNSFDQKNFQMDPPDPIHFSVQKIDKNNMLLKVKFDYHSALPRTITLYTSDDSLLLRNDGIVPDVSENDSLYTVSIPTNIDAFILQAINRNHTLSSKGYYTFFQGHNGVVKDHFKLFNVADFQNGLEVEIDFGLIAVANCGRQIVKHKSLFITDLSVVEDPSRTFNFINNTGNPTGQHTFGTLMQNMANTPVTGVSSKDFIKSWLKSYTIDINTPSVSVFDKGKVEKRSGVIRFLIAPWITMADNSSASIIDPTITLSNWENRWDALSETEILKWAPFRLTAISNRIDLRGSTIFSKNLQNDNEIDVRFDKGQAGETRFIYTLINLLNDKESEIARDINKGEIPKNINADFDRPDFLDWQGMNVILEYINVQKNPCDLKEYAYGWLNLSEKDFGTSFNSDLAYLTQQVTLSNAAPHKPNGSAIGRIRTNEKIFVPSLHNDVGTWEPPNWQFRQFEINASSHLLDMVPTTNSVIRDVAQTYNLSNINSAPILPENLTDWVYKYKYLVIQERHELPLVYNNTPLVDMAATNTSEIPFYIDMDYARSTTYFDPNTQVNQDNEFAKNLRHKLSLNTCQGCHGGENKTLFTMISPLKFGEEAKYWDTIPSTKFGKIDVRTTLTDENIEKTIEQDPTITNSPNYTLPTSADRDYINVSAFITGRTYDGSSFQDDELRDTIEVEPDDSMSGLFWVNDPSNVENPASPTNFFGHNNKKNGFNELMRRSDDMCQFLEHQCANGFDTWEIISSLNHSPMNE